jgi:hypothetical protein
MTVNVLDPGTANQPQSSPQQNQTTGNLWQRWVQFLLQPIDGASLAVFRICFGLVVVIDMLHEVHLLQDFARPEFHFKFVPWIQPFLGTGTVIEFAVISFLAATIALGFMYRFTTVAFLIAYTHFALLDKAFFQPQFYATLLVALLLCLAPANRVWSLDGVDRKQPSVVPRWAVLILQFQFAAIYFFSGVAKLHSDWMTGVLQKLWIEQYAHVPVIGSVVSQAWVPPFITYGGIASDFLLATILFWAPTFWLGVGVALVTYIVNWQVFAGSILPWMMVASLGLYARPEWPRGIVRMLGGFRLPWGAKKATGKAKTAESAAVEPSDADTGTSAVSLKNVSLLVALHVYVVVQMLLPLQQFRMPGNPGWSEVGTRFAWFTVPNLKRVMMAQFTMFEPNQKKPVMLDPLKYCSYFQGQSVAGSPELLRALAKFIADNEERLKGVRPKITAHVIVSFNQRTAQDLINPNFDLAAPGRVPPEKWIVPLQAERTTDSGSK